MGGSEGFGGPPREGRGPQQQAKPDITIAATVAGEGVNPDVLQAATRPPALVFSSVVPPPAFTVFSVQR